MTHISDQFENAVSIKKHQLEKQQDALKELESLHRKSKKLSIHWSGPVNSKNAPRIFEVGNILNAFKRRENAVQKFNSLKEVKASTDRLWKMTTRDYSQPATANFRGHLHWMKKQGLILFEEDNQVWRLTPAGMELIIDE